MKVTWNAQPDDHDYPAAAAYLTLLADSHTVDALVQSLRDAPISHQKAKDILRASHLVLLSKDNKHVAADLQKIEDGKDLSPILLVRGNFRTGAPLHIADGYHRVCASYWVDENTDIPVKLAGPE
ncbi:MAG: hypothetical protein LLG14_07335 [Nocardiaceae bacterium]|nr:hypothetical protein [Nocardiaceae bacterium]